MHKLPSQFLFICERPSGHLVLRLASKSRTSLFRFFNHSMRGDLTVDLGVFGFSFFVFVVFFSSLFILLSLLWI